MSHAMVLIGYTADTYIMADPLRGIYEYDKEVVEERYKDTGKTGDSYILE